MTIDRELYLIIIFAIYIFQGILLIICNGIVEVVLIKHRHLRRQYIILLAQIFTDILLGLGFCIAGTGRLIIKKSGCFQINRRYCLLLPWSIIITWQVLMFNPYRLISLLFPMRYFENNYSYQIKQIIFYFGSISLFILIGFIFSFRDTESILSGYCWTSDVLQPFFANLNTMIMIVSASLGVILYIIVYLLSRKHVRRIKNIQTEVSLRLFEARQRKLTITMGVSCVFTLIFYVLPKCLKFLILGEDDDPMTYNSQLLRVAVAISCNLNPLTNIAAILIKQDDIACRVKQLFPECFQKFYKCDQVMTCTRRTRSISTLSADPRKY
uniref:G-protein coupled receptors family 1 profile domain-containing protein n=1 Tax=Onchocerca volvulus TaxID=6282 RepID=A0A8R1TZG7_ONCVO